MALDDLDISTIEQSYLFHALTYRGFADIVSGSAQPQITREGLTPVAIPVPPLPEQKKIAAVLSSVDAAIEKTEAVIAQLQVVKKAMMEQLLTKGLPGRHTRFKQTDLGVIPEDWEVVSLGSVIDGIDAGWSPQCESRPAANGEWGVLKISSVTWGTFDPTENKKLPDHLVPRPNIAVHAGDVLLSRANTPELVGRTVIVEQTYSNLMLSDKLLRLRINRLVAEPRFINLVLGAPLWRELIQDAATGSSGSMKNLSQEKLRALPIPKPATKEQDAIANIISAQDAVVRGEQLALDRLRTLKSALSSSLLSGELRVPTDSVPCPV
jgi:type I restriction enzyme S subunit